MEPVRDHPDRSPTLGGLPGLTTATFFNPTSGRPHVAASHPPSDPDGFHADPARSPLEPGAGHTAKTTDGRAPRCSHCRLPAVEMIRYAGVHLCKDHFLRFVEERIKKEIRKQGNFPTGAVIGIGVSGGKDSIVALRLLHRILAPRLTPDSGGTNPRGDLRMVALTIDEGIAGYREHGLRIAEETTAALGVPHRILSYKELVGATMDDTHRVKGAQNECSFCGVFRRAALNRLAREAGCTLLVTGHNLDDTSQAVLMNVTSGDVARLARLGPHQDTKDDLVPRRMPLRTIPEKEIYLTALLEGWPHDHHECPYAVNSQRFLYRDLLAKMEQASPGTRHSLLKTLDTLRPVLPGLDAQRGTALGRCATCGEPASGTECKTCSLGRTVRTRLSAEP